MFNKIICIFTLKILIMALDRSNKLMLFPKIGKTIIVVVAIAFIFAGIRGYKFFRYIFAENVKHDSILIVPQDATFDQVIDSLKVRDVLISLRAFTWVANKKEYPGHIRPGYYLLEKGMNNNNLVNMLRIGKQHPVKVTFNNIRFKGQFAEHISKYIAADSAEIMKLFSDTALIHEFGFTPETFKAMFIPNTYEIYWTTTPENFARRMKVEYENFWNQSRREKAAAIGLSPVQVSILASIVQEETVKKDEKPIVAGVYINRLKRGIPLQADPTIKYVIGDFSIQRVLNSYLEVDSPYNTYKYAGLPPGPINFPEVSSIDAVLNYKKSNYLFMCAKDDFSGYHNFSSTLEEHNRNAEKYRMALNENNIFK